MFQYSTWLEVSKQAILYNLHQFKKFLPARIKIMPVVKSNAYGHGLVEVAKILQKEGIWGLGLVNTDEALILRKNGIFCPILALSYVNNVLTDVIKGKIDLVVYDLGFARKISLIAKKLKKVVNIHLKIDVGTSRLGLLSENALKTIQKINQLPNLKFVGIFSHLADSENYDQGYTNFQLKKFNQVINLLRQNKIIFPNQHIACSAATMVNKNSWFNLIRIGIGLYGLWPSAATEKLSKKIHPKFNLKPALSWKTKIIQIKNLPKNTSVGYGCTYRTSKKLRLAILPVGYYEGYDRRLSNKGYVLIQGKKCPVLGRICMNLMMVDIHGLPNARVGDKVVLIGHQGKKKITADEIAQELGTINYEVVSRINPLLPRIII